MAMMVAVPWLTIEGGAECAGGHGASRTTGADSGVGSVRTSGDRARQCAEADGTYRGHGGYRGSAGTPIGCDILVSDTVEIGDALGHILRDGNVREGSDVNHLAGKTG